MLEMKPAETYVRREVQSANFPEEGHEDAFRLRGARGGRLPGAQAGLRPVQHCVRIPDDGALARGHRIRVLPGAQAGQPKHRPQGAGDGYGENGGLEGGWAPLAPLGVTMCSEGATVIPSVSEGRPSFQPSW